ncbi:MAG: glycosyltransferase family 4 protein [Melioribacteraceae bacterium]|nr:glycosyltransferase family 4 protein [Melioribacteraceae bacterium]
MKILFVCSGNNKFGISPIVNNQAESLKKNGVDLDIHAIKGKGFTGYLKSVSGIRHKLKSNDYDLIHAHYSLSAIAVTISFPRKPIVVSLMGSDSKMSFFWLTIIRFCYVFKIWGRVVVKSSEMQKSLKLPKTIQLPNGVDLEKFDVVQKEVAKKNLGLSPDKNYILFLSNPSRYEKNYQLAEDAVSLIKKNSAELITVFNKEHSQVRNYLYAVDLLLLTSLWEGSPNAVKEAMCCNLPVVATDVGDVKWLFGDMPGYYLSSFRPEDMCELIDAALIFAKKNGRTEGRTRILELGLDSQSIATRLINLYKEVLKEAV